MSKTIAKTVALISRLEKALIESDQQDFEAGALKVGVEAAEIVYLTGLTQLAAGCVVQRLQPERIHQPLERWLDSIEARLIAAGISSARIYANSLPCELTKTLANRGYRSQVEVALVSALLSPSTHEIAAVDLTLVPVLTTAHWQQKLDLHQAALKGPDGHTNDAYDWVRKYFACSSV